MSFLVVLMLAAAMSSTSGFSPEIEHTLSEFIQSTMKCRQVPGLTLAIVRGNDIWAKGYGVADLKTGRPVTERTVFNIASVTKAFTTTLLAVILQERNLTFSTKVSKILGPEYAFVNDIRMRGMTIRDLLAHRTGLARLDFTFIAGIPKKIGRTEYSRRLRFLLEEDSFRDGFTYNNLMYALAGHIAEVLTGDTWENLIINKLLLPLGMLETRPIRSPFDLLQENFAKPYFLADKGFQPSALDIYTYFPVEPAAGLYSTGADMLKWMRFVLNRGRNEAGIPLVHEALLGEAWDIQNILNMDSMVGPDSIIELNRPAFPVSDTQIGYGYGMVISSYRGYRKWWHDGVFGAYQALEWLFPDLNIGVFLSINGPGTPQIPFRAVRTIMYFVSDLLLGEKPWLSQVTSCTFPMPFVEEPMTFQTRLRIAPPPRNFVEYIGQYGSPLFPDALVSTTKGSQTLILQIGILQFTGFPTNHIDVFELDLIAPVEVALAEKFESKPMHTITFIRDVSITGFVANFGVDVVFTRGAGFFDPIPPTVNQFLNENLKCWPLPHLPYWKNIPVKPLQYSYYQNFQF
ncbi:hypothetical protein CHS0354_037839 [Potamilus streckersoni]|uniref:Beta-lactamase-related domain-containing protein n=1 Tax=Potamilus streckersoni TaxID=2493646 RepID=A0AAE0SJM6_9BIVA|nr:hypothetical protein CHS0354_037839 [Potamilus streckersoni]